MEKQNNYADKAYERKHRGRIAKWKISEHATNFSSKKYYAPFLERQQ